MKKSSFSQARLAALAKTLTDDYQRDCLIFSGELSLPQRVEERAAAYPHYFSSDTDIPEAENPHNIYHFASIVAAHNSNLCRREIHRITQKHKLPDYNPESGTEALIGMAEHMILSGENHMLSLIRLIDTASQFHIGEPVSFQPPPGGSRAEDLAHATENFAMSLRPAQRAPFMAAVEMVLSAAFEGKQPDTQYARIQGVAETIPDLKDRKTFKVLADMCVAYARMGDGALENVENDLLADHSGEIPMEIRARHAQLFLDPVKLQQLVHDEKTAQRREPLSHEKIGKAGGKNSAKDGSRGSSDQVVM
jgi:hypothetical protein